MFIEPVSTEIIQQVSNDDLRQNYDFMYSVLTGKTIEDAFENILGTWRCKTGIPEPLFNAVFDSPEEDQWDLCIDEHLKYFGEAHLPFVWYIDENENLEFQNKLLDRGFFNAGVFQGVIGPLNVSSFLVPDGCEFERVQSETSMDEFNELMSSTFGVGEEGAKMLKNVMWDAAQDPNPKMVHWIARHQGKVVSILSTIINGDVASFWNGASLPEYRRQGYASALSRIAIKDAMERGCHTGISYLMTEAMAFGISSKLGAQTKWRFNVFVAPGLNDQH